MHERLRVTETFIVFKANRPNAGRPFIFIRLTGCNLRCHYCDTEYAFSGGQTMTFTEITDRIQKWPTPWVELTGGEPLLQPPPGAGRFALRAWLSVLIEPAVLRM